MQILMQAKRCERYCRKLIICKSSCKPSAVSDVVENYCVQPQDNILFGENDVNIQLLFFSLYSLFVISILGNIYYFVKSLHLVISLDVLFKSTTIITTATSCIKKINMTFHGCLRDKLTSTPNFIEIAIYFANENVTQLHQKIKILQLHYHCAFNVAIARFCYSYLYCNCTNYEIQVSPHCYTFIFSQQNTNYSYNFNPTFISHRSFFLSWSAREGF